MTLSLLLQLVVTRKSSSSSVGEHLTNWPQKRDITNAIDRMDALDVHLARYIQKYRDIYPQSAIILIKARLAGNGIARVGRGIVQPAIAPLRAILDDEDGASEPRLLIHVLSGGGSCSLHHLYRSYSENTGGARIPKHVTIFDSAPGIFTFQFATNVLTAGIKAGWMKALISPMAYLVAIMYWVAINILGMADDQKTWASNHNDPASNNEARRAYIYSDTDKMVTSAIIEAHADEAERKGFQVWRRELFKGSPHVAHMRTDPERYWNIMKVAWAGGA